MKLISEIETLSITIPGSLVHSLITPLGKSLHERQNDLRPLQLKMNANIILKTLENVIRLSLFQYIPDILRGGLLCGNARWFTKRKTC